MTPRTAFLTVGLVLSASGFASLVYQILWVRYFSYLLGGTVISVSLVSAVFLGGLALGYRYLGRLGDGLKRPLFFYAGLEAGIALFSLLPLSVHGFLPSLVDPIFLALAPTSSLLYTFQFLVICLLVLPATICMGGTVPVVLAVFRNTPLATALARFYFLNTIGGALGTLAAVFVLLPQLGATASHFLAVGISLGSGVVAFLLAGRVAQSAPATTPVQRQNARLAPALAGLTFLCGFFTLAAEILWSRLLTLYLGNTIFAFGTILGIVLAAIAIGSIIYPLLPARLIHSWRFAAALLLAMTLSVALPALYYDQAALLFHAVNVMAGESWGLLVLLQMGSVLTLIGVPTFCSGLFFPLIAGLSNPAGGCRSQLAGSIGFWNTCGTILGSVFAAFIVLPFLGLRDGFLLLSLLVCSIGLLVCLVQLFRVNRAQAWRWGLGLILFAALPLLFNRSWDQKMVHSGVYLYSPYYQEAGSLKKGLGHYRLLYSRHDRESSVSINENRFGERSLLINGKVDASSGVDLGTQYLLAHLPLLHHPDPEATMVIGLGSGVTLGSAALYPSSRIDCLEISPAVVEASSYFQEFNRGVLADPRVQLKIADGMYYLRTKGKTYDVIISEPSNPWQLGNADLFSLDFYRQVRDRLDKDGIFCQWIPLYDLSTHHLKTALATFHRVFPHSLLFLNSGDLLVLGANAPISRLETLAGVSPDIVRQLSAIGISSAADLYRDKLLYPGSAILPHLKGIAINTLNRSALEFAAKPLFTSGLVGPYLEANTRWLESM